MTQEFCSGSIKLVYHFNTGLMSLMHCYTGEQHKFISSLLSKHILLHKMATRAKKENFVQLSQVKMLTGFRLTYTEVISTNTNCACHRHLSLHCKWPPERVVLISFKKLIYINLFIKLI